MFLQDTLGLFQETTMSKKSQRGKALVREAFRILESKNNQGCMVAGC